MIIRTNQYADLIHWLLLLDEPVSGLDPLARVQVRNIIKSLQQQGMTILISSHILSDLAEICTSIGIMELGKLVESSGLQELYDRSSQGQHQLLISTLGSVEDLLIALKRSELVQRLEVLAGVPVVQVQFAGSLEDCAGLLKSLIESGLPISNFHRTQETLENIFLKLGYKQTI